MVDPAHPGSSKSRFPRLVHSNNAPTRGRAPSLVNHAVSLRKPYGRWGEELDETFGGPPSGLLIVDPRPIVRACIVAAIGGTAELEPVWPVADIAEIREHQGAGTRFYAVVVHAGGSSPGAIAGLSRRIDGVRSIAPESAVVVVGAETDRRSAVEAFNIGVRGYLTADTGVEFVIDALKFVRAGWTVFSPFHGTAQAS